MEIKLRLSTASRAPKRVTWPLKFITLSENNLTLMNPAKVIALLWE
jgi:hypothetical protein